MEEAIKIGVAVIFPVTVGINRNRIDTRNIVRDGYISEEYITSRRNVVGPRNWSIDGNVRTGWGIRILSVGELLNVDIGTEVEGSCVLNRFFFTKCTDFTRVDDECRPWCQVLEGINLADFSR